MSPTLVWFRRDLRLADNPALSAAAVLRQAGVQPGRTYPEPVVDLAATRREALEAYQAIR